MKPIKPVAGLPPRQTGNTSADGQLLRLWLQRALQIHDENAQEIAKRLKELDDAINSGGGTVEPGKDGITPHIGANGNWWLGDTDTGQPSRGEPGYTPVKGLDYFDGDDGLTPYIGANGNWWLGDTDTGEPSQGEPGYTPQRGVDYWTAADQTAILTDLGAKFADYVIEAGTTNGWKWEKWNSGKYICWGIFTETQTHYTTVAGFYGYYSSQFNYPIVFPEPPIIHFNCKIGNGFAAPAGDVMRSSSVARCYALSTANGSVYCVWELYVVGRWK